MNKEAKTNSSGDKEDSGLLNFGRIMYDPPKTSIGTPMVTLSNNIRVANFSTPNALAFVDGTILPGCSATRARALALEGQEIEIENVGNGLQFRDITYRFEMTAQVRKELTRLYDVSGYDILIIPAPVMIALKESGLPIGRCRCVRRDEKTNAILIDEFSL